MRILFPLVVVLPVVVLPVVEVRVGPVVVAGRAPGAAVTVTVEARKAPAFAAEVTVTVVIGRLLLGVVSPPPEAPMTRPRTAVPVGMSHRLGPGLEDGEDGEDGRGTAWGVWSTHRGWPDAASMTYGRPDAGSVKVRDI